MANRNRNAGNGFERTIVKELKSMGYDVVTSRAESKNMDDKGVDILGNIPYFIQCKNSKTNPNYVQLLEDMPKEKPGIIIHKKTKKANKNFIPVGEYVIMNKEIFYKLISKDVL
jgi:Holliday junction resolvase